MTAEPERIGRYRILCCLGSGGMGDVYDGVDETLQRRVALKVIRADRRLNVEAQERFLREARILSKLDHANICRAYDYVRGDEAGWSSSWWTAAVCQTCCRFMTPRHAPSRLLPRSLPCSW